MFSRDCPAIPDTVRWDVSFLLEKTIGSIGGLNEAGQTANKITEPVEKEISKRRTISNDRYVDWLIY
jgi:hypothetical protein